LATAPAAFAHTKSETHADWRIDGRIVHLTFTVPDIEAKRLASPADTAPGNATVLSYLSSRLGAASGGKPCLTLGNPQALAALPGFRRFDFTFACTMPGPIALHSGAFFDLVPSHVTFAQIADGTGNVTEQLFARDHQTLDDATAFGKSRLADASFLDYIRLGVIHILTGVDHMSFLFGLVLLARRLRDLVFVITGFTLGHSLTLALAVTGIVRPESTYIDALIGLTIALVGAENIAVATRRPGIVGAGLIVLLGGMALAGALGAGGLPPLLLAGAALFSACYLNVSGSLQDAARLRLVVTLVFGLIHGFGFAADLFDMRLPKTRLAELLVGFNLGVELGQLLIVLLLTFAALLLTRFGLGVSRRFAVDAGSAALAGFGLYLLVTRAYA
jgi:hypothetical protein